MAERKKQRGLARYRIIKPQHRVSCCHRKVLYRYNANLCRYKAQKTDGLTKVLRYHYLQTPKRLITSPRKLNFVAAPVWSINTRIFPIIRLSVSRQREMAEILPN